MNSGHQAELIAKDYLQKQGLTWVASNVSYPFGELDIIMQEHDAWVFIEVKYRATQHFGGAISAISNKKIARLRKAAAYYLQQHQINAPCRFDLLAIEGSKIHWLKNIF